MFGFTVDSYLEIFTTIFGWHVYNVILEAVLPIILLPFIGIILSNWAKAYVDGAESGAATTAVRDAEYRLYTAIFVLFFACVPMIEINRYNLSYQQQETLTQPSKTISGKNTGTSYDMAFADSPVKTKIPLWWATVFTISEGVTLAMKEGLKLDISDLRSFQQMAQTAEIKDTKLRYEVQRFISECYAEARSLVLLNDISAMPDGQDWFGSAYYRSTPGLYDQVFAKNAVTGFKLDPVRDADSYTAPNRPEWGRPSCKEWYEDKTSGLRTRLIDAIRKDKPNLDEYVSGDKLFKLYQKMTFQGPRNTDAIYDGIIHTTFATGNMTNGSTYQGGGLLEAGRDTAATAGLIIGNGYYELMMANIIAALPIIQPMILMGIYMMLGLYLILAKFSPGAVVQGSLLIFTVKFWTVLWLVAKWLVDNLTLAMYPDIDGLLGRTVTSDGKNLILNLTTLVMYAVLPLLWSRMMVLAGSRAGATLDTSLLKAAQEGTQEAAKSTKDVGNWAYKKITKK